MSVATEPSAEREEVERLVRASLVQRARRLSPRELRLEITLSGLFLVLTALLMALAPGRVGVEPIAIPLVLAYAIASRVDLPVGGGAGTPTQLFLVALFAHVDAPVVPLLAALGTALGTSWAAVTGRVSWDRLICSGADALYVLGPAAVLTATGYSDADAFDVVVILGAFAAQCAVGFVAAKARDRRARPLRLLQGWAVDAAFTPIGMLAVAATDELTWAPLMMLPLVALVAQGARDRSERTEHLRIRLEALQRERRRLQIAVRRIGDAFASNLDLDALVEIVARVSAEAMDVAAVRAGVVLGDTVLPRLAEGDDPALVALLEKAERSALVSGGPAVAESDGGWAISAPIGAAGDPAAVVALGRASAPFNAEELELFSYLCEQAAVSAGNVLRHEALHRQALTDELTGLANHRRLQELLVERTTTPGAVVGLILLDLDDFKQVNDRFGHQAGDLVLRSVGRCLRALCRDGDEPARYGGEELAVVVADTDLEGLVAFGERLRQGIETLLVQDPDGERLPVTVSVGVALAGPGTATPAPLIAAADRALYRAKLAGKNCVRAARPQRGLDRAGGRRRHDTDQELRSALEQGELSIHYQPKVSLADGAVVGVEALLRWHHPQLGLVGPSRFLSYLEGTALMPEFTEWVLRRATLQAAAWRRAGLTLPVAVNVTAQDIDDPRLPSTIAELLASAGARPEDLRLEITEHMAMSDADGAVRTLRELRAMGLGLSLDDFGSGYSSLTRLRDLPVDELKLDRTFLRTSESRADLAVVQAAISLGRDLGLTVVAEGVEDAQRLAVLRDLGCALAQGFHIAPPLLPAELERWIADRPGDGRDAVPRRAPAP